MMAEVESMDELLVDALQDLHDAEKTMVEQLPNIADQASDALFRTQLDEIALQSEEQRRKLAGLIERRDAPVDGAENIWLRAILDDANRDCEMVAKGPLLDIALIGAIRKAKQAERVSYETAIALSEALEASDSATLETIRDEEAVADTRLAELLQRLTTDARSA